MSAAGAARLTPRQLAEFGERGFLVIRNLLCSTDLQPLIEECEWRVGAMAE
jgi:hypothetical protein